MSAAVLPFTGQWQGRFEASDFELDCQQEAMADARNLMEAKREASNWLSALALGLIGVLTAEQRKQLEAALALRPDDQHARQALTVVRLSGARKEHRDRVLAVIDTLNQREAF